MRNHLFFSIFQRVFLPFGWGVSLLLLISGSGCRSERLPAVVAPPIMLASRSEASLDESPQNAVADQQASDKQVIAFCAACHVMPPAESFPRDAWRHEVMRGYGFYAKSGRKDLEPPPPIVAIEYFRRRAPETLDLKSKIEEGKPAFFFKQEEIVRKPGRDAVTAGLAYMAFGELPGDPATSLYAIDMRRGELLSLKPGGANTWEPKFHGLHNPCHFEISDLDADGKSDMVIADLGSYKPEEHSFGRVLWLHDSGEGRLTADELLAGVGRVADARPADFNGDGKLDLVVAEFGMHQTGGVWLLTQTDATPKGPEFSRKKLLNLSGASHVPIGDFDGDGKLDFVALVSQEYERVILFHNEGEGNFAQKILWQAPDPAFGLSGVEPVDLDQDGDLDLLFTSGDTFDGPYLKASHGIHWLENEGEGKFAYHRIAYLLGAYSAKAGDLDGDGDLDLVASCWAPTPSSMDTSRLPTIVCGRQTSKGQFEMSVLHRGELNYVTVALGDLDEDGDLDLIAGLHRLQSQNPREGGLLFFNQTTESK